MRGSHKGSIKTLVLALQYQHAASYYDDWADAFANHHRFDAEFCNILSAKPSDLARSMKDVDVVILLHSCTADTTEYLDQLAPVLADRRRAKLLAFVGNEYNSAIAPLADKISILKKCNADFIATQLLGEAGEYLYKNTGAKILAVPHALNRAAFNLRPPHAGRPIDIGVRSFRYPASLGDNDRNRLIDYFAAKGTSLGLALDISQESRFGREAWAQFLSSCKGTISSEAGSWYLDRDDALARAVHSYLAKHRKGIAISHTGPLRRLARKLPMPVREALARVLKSGPFAYEGFEGDEVAFDQIYDELFKTVAKAPIYAKAISSRHFDAIGTKTCQIMFAGRFNDILTAHEHYIPLELDFSNIDQVLATFNDPAKRQGVVDRAYTHVCDAHTYPHRLNQIAKALGG